MSGRLTAMQLGALEQIDLRGSFPENGWGGYGPRTLRSLERRGLVRLAGTGRYSLTERGHQLLRALDPWEQS